MSEYLPPLQGGASDGAPVRRTAGGEVAAATSDTSSQAFHLDYLPFLQSLKVRIDCVWVMEGVGDLLLVKGWKMYWVKKGVILELFCAYTLSTSK